MAFDSDTVLRLVLSQPNPFIELSYTACIIQLIFIQSSEPSLVSREFSGAMGSAEYRDWILKMSRERERYRQKRRSRHYFIPLDGIRTL